MFVITSDSLIANATTIMLYNLYGNKMQEYYIL